MDIELSEISEIEFKKCGLPILFENELTDRVFAIVSNHKNKFKFAWQSTNLKPVIIALNRNSTLCSIGIDLNFVIFDFYKGDILLNLDLTYFFYDTKIYGGFLYIITELEIIIIDILNLSIIDICSLPDYFTDIEFNEEFVTVKYISGETNWKHAHVEVGIDK